METSRKRRSHSTTGWKPRPKREKVELLEIQRTAVVDADHLAYLEDHSDELRMAALVALDKARPWTVL